MVVDHDTGRSIAFQCTTIRPYSSTNAGGVRPRTTRSAPTDRAEERVMSASIEKLGQHFVEVPWVRDALEFVHAVVRERDAGALDKVLDCSCREDLATVC